jgi:hypothetical protein
MKKTYMILVVMICSSLVMSACTDSRQGNDTGNNNQSLRQLGVTQNDAFIPLTTHEGQAYIPLEPLIDVIGYQMEFEQQSSEISIGDIDVFYSLTLGSKEVKSEEEAITLTAPPVLLNQTLYAPVTLLDQLFLEDIHYTVENNNVRVHAVSDDNYSMDEMENDLLPENNEPFFQDDPEDPFRGEKDIDQEVWSRYEEGDSIPVAKLKNINMNALIRKAKQYMGVPYKFGAKPYPKSKKFDCSSYTQYVYGKFGIDLKRVSRNQAKQGHTVSRKKLRKGDLVFFSVPGRFKSDKTVGHVGIYIGNGKMINTFSNKKDVHITNVNKGYWSKKFLKAKRVAY